MLISALAVVPLVWATSSSSSLGSIFTAPGTFPTSLYGKYYNNPTGTSQQVQPVITDPVSHKVYPFNLTNPETIPKSNTDPHPLPPVASSSRLLTEAVNQIHSIATNPVFGGNTCTQCQAILEIAKFLSLAAPSQGPAFFIELCETLKLSSSCAVTYALNGVGSILTQVVANADVGNYDGQMLCQNFFNMCPLPPTSPLNLTGWFAKPKPNPLPPAKERSGKRLKVLHISDLHIDPRYATGTEANCTTNLCCRSGGFNSASPNTTLLPAPRYGAYLCDTPYALVASVLEAIPVLTDTVGSGFDFTVYTGDLVSHDPDNELGRDYVEYAETVVYDLLKRTLGSGPVYATLGNHDSYNQAQDAPHSIGQGLADEFSWNYNHLASLWQHENWLPEAAVELAKAHYAAFMVKRTDGLRIISLNTDMWYKANYFNYINLTHPDTSGMLRFLTDELQDAEDAGDRVWIMGHVLSGWDGTNPLLNPTNLFYQIVDRFSPHVIANIFFGHTHEDQLTIFYSNNATDISADTALGVSWIAPSITGSPFLLLISVVISTIAPNQPQHWFPTTFEIMDAHTWKADVNSFPSLDHQTEFGPTFVYEYNTRETYGESINWQDTDPLNATWWHLVTEAMENNSSLVTTFNTFQGKSSIETAPCTGDCIAAKICYIRSGSASIAMQNCLEGFGSVQGG